VATELVHRLEERYLEIYTELGGVRYRSGSVVKSSLQRHQDRPQRI
jgi:hypothetical protein